VERKCEKVRKVIEREREDAKSKKSKKNGGEIN
jgi:hypothetical protein